jgi:CheY-like chemotaxis protein
MLPKKLLVIDDEEDIRDVAGVTLEFTRGWTIETADCGAAGVKRATEFRPDVILLDVMMPDMDGPATFRVLQSRQDTQSIPVIFLTAKVQPADLRKFTQLGVRGVIAKPFDPLKLADQVEELLDWKNAAA